MLVAGGVNPPAAPPAHPLSFANTMSNQNQDPTLAPPPERARGSWVAPEVRELPRLTELTLQTGIPAAGSTESGGATVIA